MGVSAKSKGLFSGKKSSIGVVSSLTPETHLLRQLALRYFVDKSLRIKDVAEKLNTTNAKIKAFFNDPSFVEELESRMDKVHGIGKEFMQSQAKISLVNLYEEMRRREIDGELKDIPLRELHKIIVDTQKELRLDTPGAFTSKVGVTDLTNLQDRYKKSLSGRLQQKQLKNVTPKKKLLEEEKGNFNDDNQTEARGSG